MRMRDTIHFLLYHSFGWDYQNSCSIDLTDVLMELQDGYAETVMYDLYMQNGANSLYPVPIMIFPNLQAPPGGESQTPVLKKCMGLGFRTFSVGKQTLSRSIWTESEAKPLLAVAVRRFFYVDGSLGRSRNSDGSLGALQVRGLCIVADSSCLRITFLCFFLAGCPIHHQHVASIYTYV